MTTSSFRRYQEVAVVEHVDSTRQPKEGGEVLHGTVIQAAGLYVQVRVDDGRTATFWAESGWTAWDGVFHWRLFPVCDRDGCDTPLAGEVFKDPDDPRCRRFCSEDCLTVEAERTHGAMRPL
jgi:hypothetical protein